MILHCNDQVPWMLPSRYIGIIYINGGCDILFMIFGTPHCLLTLMARRGKSAKMSEADFTFHLGEENVVGSLFILYP